jgi:dihydrofolate synthase/folylpolyglutamate synthase
VVDPELSIITTISLDHTEMLGDTLAAIAGEKAGIIKPGKPVLMGKLPPEAAAVVSRVAEERGSPLYRLTDRFPDEASLPRTNLAGDFQRWNAAIAVYATEILADRFPVKDTSALMSVEWAGRWQTIRDLGAKAHSGCDPQSGGSRSAGCESTGTLRGRGSPADYPRGHSWRRPGAQLDGGSRLSRARDLSRGAETGPRHFAGVHAELLEPCGHFF